MLTSVFDKSMLNLYFLVVIAKVVINAILKSNQLESVVSWTAPSWVFLKCNVMQPFGVRIK